MSQINGLEYPRLTVTLEDGRDAIFEMTAADVEPLIKTGELFKDSDGFLRTGLSYATGEERSATKIDAGNGTAGVRVQFSGWEGSDGQWGTDAQDGLGEYTATGRPAQDQISVLFNTLIQTDIDSTNPATLEFWAFSDTGQYEPLQVATQEPSLPMQRSQTSSFDGTITFISVTDISDPLSRFEANS